ncbi:hypothetical protein PsorP6_013534 [Peronosclerospora sorghi]|uniref:Uncharacterized protein n=1 Tax=Peronosclerospora sorghi TaxID=230839 RepID=A0ACC0VI71_9STRA|nr:hypothetical protein PsorP6_013534 [Peronosclerospora sorghi]
MDIHGDEKVAQNGDTRARRGWSEGLEPDEATAHDDDDGPFTSFDVRAPAAMEVKNAPLPSLALRCAPPSEKETLRNNFAASGNMVKPFYALVGLKGSAFSVKIDDSESVADLKDAIKAQNEDITCDADELELFLARTESGAWLESRTNDVEKLKQGELTTAIEELTKENKQLQGEAGLQAVLEGMPSPTTNQIHVLVVIPNEGLESRVSRVSL